MHSSLSSTLPNKSHWTHPSHNCSLSSLFTSSSEHQATAAARTWWSEVPLSYMSIIAISVASAFTFVTFVAIIICLLRRRHVKGKARLPQVDMYWAPSEIRGDLRSSWSGEGKDQGFCEEVGKEEKALGFLQKTKTRLKEEEEENEDNDHGFQEMTQKGSWI